MTTVKVDDQMVVMMDPADKFNRFLGANRSREKKFVFDQAFGPTSTQVPTDARAHPSCSEGVDCRRRSTSGRPSTS